MYQSMLIFKVLKEQCFLEGFFFQLEKERSFISEILESIKLRNYHKTLKADDNFSAKCCKNYDTLIESLFEPYQATLKAKMLPDFTQAKITVVTCLVMMSKSTSDTD